MRRGIWRRWLLPALLLGLLLAAGSPGMVRFYWRLRAANSVRSGVQLCRDLGCFACHGDLGAGGIPDPGTRTPAVPGWTGGEWTRYVLTDAEVRRYILEGVDHAREGSAIPMPAYRAHLSARQLDSLVAAFKVISGMVQPPQGSAARRGMETATRWQCFSCHGPGGAGGSANPGSLAGFIPGWYGADFRELVRDREEFDQWILTGAAARLRASRLASYLLRRQRLAMPAYPRLTAAERDGLWAYAMWLAATDGGHHPLPR